MKILLINPYSPKSDHIQPPLGLGYLATSLVKNKHSVSILDANKEKLSVTKLKPYIEKFNPDFIGFQVYTSTIEYVKSALRIIKQFNPNIATIVGGPEPSSRPKQIFETLEKNLDFAFCGEAEIGLPKLINSLPNRKGLIKIPGLVYKNKSRVKVNKPVCLLNIDSFGEPAWDLIKPETYPASQHGAFFKQFPIAPIITTRGCPYNCTFCAGHLISGKTFRKRKINSIIKEILYLHKQRGINEIHIVDDNFTLDKQFAEKLLKNIIKLHLPITFAVPNGIRIETLDKNLLYLMKKAGFYLISVGIESGSNRILKLMHKNLIVKEIEEKIKLINQSKIDSAAFFILGYPGETEKEIGQTIEFSLKLNLLRANYFLFTPLPGTEVFKKLRVKNNFSPSFTSPTFYGKIPPEKLKKLQREAFIRFYFFRPNVLIKNLVRIKKMSQIYYLTKRGLNWLS